MGTSRFNERPNRNEVTINPYIASAIVRKKVYGPSRLLATRHRYISALKLYVLYLSDGYKRCTYRVNSLHPYITEVLENTHG